jgi:hypothetical protein
MAKGPKKPTASKVTTTTKTPPPPDGMTYATEYEIKQLILCDFMVMDPTVEVSAIKLQRYPHRIPTGDFSVSRRTVIASCDS